MMSKGSGATTPAEAGLFALLEIVGDPALHKARLEQLVAARQEQVDAAAAADKAKKAADDAMSAAKQVIADSEAAQAKAKAATEGAEAEVAKQARGLDAARAEISRDREAVDADRKKLTAEQAAHEEAKGAFANDMILANKQFTKREADILAKEGLAQTRLDEANAAKEAFERKLAGLREKIAEV